MNSPHHLLRNGRTDYDDAGIWRGLQSRFYAGYAKCSCGALSEKGISRFAAWQWFRKHKEADQ